MIGTGYKCDQCGHLEVGVRFDRYESMATPPAGWLMLYVMVDDRDTSSAGHHFCSGKCAKVWVLDQEREGKIRHTIKPEPEPLSKAQMMWGPLKYEGTTAVSPYRHESTGLCDDYGCVPYRDSGLVLDAQGS